MAKMLALLLVAASTGGARAGRPDTKAQIESLAQQLVAEQLTVGVVAVLIEGGRTTTITQGAPSVDGKRALDGDTVFAIGSVTKTFTALLLADLIERKRLATNAPVKQFLPQSVTVPARGERQITLADLATHASGLPRLPTNFDPDDPADPYADYTVEKLYAFLSAYQLPRAPGEAYEYSNLGSGLLGHALARHEKQTFEALVMERICKPLGMMDTSVNLPPDRRPRLAQGHNLQGEPVKPWRLDALAGCGALWSTANDMAAYIKANLGLTQVPLASAMLAAHRPRRTTTLGSWRIGLGWLVNETGEVAWHDGGTFGSYSFVGFDKKRQRGLVWLSNSGLWEIGGVRERLELVLLGKPTEPPKVKKPVKLDSALLARCVGEYELVPGAVLAVSLDGRRLVLSVRGQQGGSLLYPESETEFFLLETDTVTVSFVKNEAGAITQMILHDGKNDTPGKKIK